VTISSGLMGNSVVYWLLCTLCLPIIASDRTSWHGGHGDAQSMLTHIDELPVKLLNF
jgi:hypothetical protein